MFLFLSACGSCKRVLEIHVLGCPPSVFVSVPVVAAVVFVVWLYPLLPERLSVPSLKAVHA